MTEVVVVRERACHHRKWTSPRRCTSKIQNRNSHTRWTRPRGPDITNTFKYTGQAEDASSSLYKLGIRYYDPNLGRFTQQDPTGQDSHYTYSGNNPVNFVDPSGKACTGYYDSSIDAFQPIECTYTAEELAQPIGEDNLTDDQRTCLTRNLVTTGTSAAVSGSLAAGLSAPTGPGALFVGGATAIGVSVVGLIGGSTACLIGG